MAIQSFAIIGSVVNGKTGRGIARLRVEAWDKDVKYNDLLGNADTDQEGRFVIAFDTSYFREFAPDTEPDLFFRVYQGNKLLKSTEDAVVKNAPTTYQVTIRVDMPAERPAARDRVSAVQVLKAADFFQQSDFKGVYQEFRSKAGTSLGFVADVVMNTVRNLDIQPVTLQGNREAEVVGQDVESAQKNLAANNIAVKEVKPYNPKLDSASLADFTALPLRLRAGQQVVLHEENGKVRYYSLVKEKQGSRNETAPAAAAQQDKLLRMEAELARASQQAAQKEEQLHALQQEMAALRRDQEEIKRLLQSETLSDLQQIIQKLEQLKEKEGGSDASGKEPGE
jgi:hypothetical protein